MSADYDYALKRFESSPDGVCCNPDCSKQARVKFCSRYCAHHFYWLQKKAGRPIGVRPTVPYNVPFKEEWLGLARTENQRTCYKAYGEAGQIVRLAAERTGIREGTIRQSVKLIQKYALYEEGDPWEKRVNEALQAPWRTSPVTEYMSYRQ